MQVDVTFAVTPKYSIASKKKHVPYNGLCNSHFIHPANDIDHVSESDPCLFILLSSKKREHYKKAFVYTANRIEELGCKLSHKPHGDRNARYDYEIALREEWSKAFYVDNTEGCLTHLS